MLEKSDERLLIILDSLKVFVPEHVVKKHSVTILESEKVEKFLENGNCSLLELCFIQGGNCVINNELHFAPNCEYEVHFRKKAGVSLDAKNFKEMVFVGAIHHSPIESLLRIVHDIYGPLLLGNQQFSSALGPTLQTALTELDSGLQTVVSRDSKASKQQGGGIYNNEKQSFYFLTPQEEIQYWEDEKSQRASEICDIFQKRSLKEEFTLLNQKKLEDIIHSEESLIDKIRDTLDSLWMLECDEKYPQKRMDHLLSVIAGCIGRFIQLKLGHLKIWTDNFFSVKKELDLAQEICHEWRKVTKELTGELWPLERSHTWNGTPHEDQFIIDLNCRLDQILHVRSSYEQVLQNLEKHEMGEISPEKIFQPFEKVQPLHITPYTSEIWKNATMKFEESLIPLEKLISEKLKLKFSKFQSQPHLLLVEFLRNKELLLRANIFKDLSQQRTVLLAQLKSYTNSLKNEFNNLGYENVETSITKETVEGGKTISSLVNSLIYVKQIQQKIELIYSSSKMFLSDFGEKNTLEKECQELLSDVSEFCSNKFGSWKKDIQSRMSKELEPELKGSMIKFNELKKVVVNYNDRLVTVLKEVRQLSILGFDIPYEIRKLANNAHQFYIHAIALKQIANYYNTVHSQVIRSQSSMLLKAASNFEEIIFQFESAKKSWSKTNSEAHIAKLRNAAEQFTSENRKLRKYHNMVGEKVIQLMSIDLLKEKDKWMEKMNEVKKVFKFLETQGYTDMDGWKIHWDYQLYKALEYQYQIGLESLHENLPEMRILLVLKEREVQYSPSLERIKERYFESAREFISFPGEFPGLSNCDVFKKMIHFNLKAIQLVYQKGHMLFSRLLKLCKKISDQIVLPSIDLEDHVEEKELNFWENNFKMLKQKGKELDVIENSIKVDCFIIFTESLKATIEDQLQKLNDALIKALKKAAQSHLQKIEVFVSECQEKMDKEPKSMEEIGKAHAFCKKISEQKESVRLEFDMFEKKNRMLRSLVGVGLDPSAVKDKFNDFDDTLLGHEHYLEERTNSLKGEIESKFFSFKNSLSKFATRWHELKPKSVVFVSDESAIKEIAMIKEKREEFNDMRTRASEVLKECEYFGINAQFPPEFNEIDQDLTRFESVWKNYELFMQDVGKHLKEDWLSFKGKAAFVIEDFCNDWIGRLAHQEKNGITIHIREQVDNYSQFVDVVKYLQGEGWTSEHWSSLFRTIGIQKGLTIEKVTASVFIDKLQRILEKIDEIKELNVRAGEEDKLRKALQELKLWESNTEFNLSYHTGANGVKTPLIKEWKDILTSVGDNQNLVQSLKESTYSDLFSEEICAWENKLSNIDQYLHNMNIIQRKWIYLEPIFSRGSLPSEHMRFMRVDREFKSIMIDVDADKRVMQLAKKPLKERLKTMVEQLEVCQRALSEFLEEKRSSFPRFYFIGDDDLLEILGQSKNPLIIQTHLKKLFAGIHKVNFNDNQTRIEAICSAAGECVNLKSAVVITESVEEWLAKLDMEMNRTLEHLMIECDESEEFDLDKYPEQILCLCAHINFCRKCEDAIQKQSLESLHSEMKAQLSEYTSVDPKDNRVLEMKIKSLILDLIHDIDIIEQLLQRNVSKLDDWIWKKQLRFYLDSTDGKKKCYIQMCRATFPYTFEYQGNVQKLVHTPLTDKCYLTLTQGMHLGYGGNPYGPAGTGKTESVKALGSLFGRQVLVFNCDEGLDFRSMGRIFIGLVKCGAWGCFDEFNRLKEDQLSAISQQIQIIQAAIKEKQQDPIEILGKNVIVNSNSGIFVTLNPAGKGYGGRSKLPDNLKQLFRSVAMSIPDNELIAEVILFSEGFKHAKYIGKKLVSIFTLCRQLLSSQQHYDWGLRALKTVLGVGGNLIKKARKEAQESNRSVTIEEESQIIIKSIRVNTISKLTFEDHRIFKGILEDVFPGIEALDISYKEIEDSICQVLKEMNLEIIEGFIKKILQFYEACKQRMGVVLVGPSGSGKTTVWKVLQLALCKLGKTVKYYTLNPKSMSRTQLLGHMDMDTREWFDGILTYNSRMVVKEPPDVDSWIICDGDIDPEWIESLNSVLDDNHLLTMPNGERIQFGSNVNFIFETHSLRYASPATISRMGMIFLSEEDISTQNVINSWVNTLETDKQPIMKQWMDNYFVPSLKLLQREKEFIIDTSLQGIIISGISHVKQSTSKKDFLISIIRGLGGYLPMETRIYFARNILSMAGEEKKINEKKILDYFYSKDIDSFVPYEFCNVSDPVAENENAMIKTVDIQRTIDVILPWIKNMESFILIGPEGCGKSMLMDYIFSTEITNSQVAIVHCNSQTKSHHIIDKLNQCCAIMTSAHGKVLRSREGERLILFLKDLNLPKPDKYGTTELVEFLKQLLTYKGYYDSSLEWITIENIQVIVTLNPTTVGRYPLSSRFISVMRVASLNYPRKDQLQLIYYELIRIHFLKKMKNHPSWNLQKNMNILSESMVDLFDKVCSKFPLSDFPHYLFTPREITKWLSGLFNYSLIENGKPDDLIDIWIYEARRLFRDRIVKQTAIYDSIESSVVKAFEGVSGYTGEKKKMKMIYTSLVGTTKERKLSLVTLKDFVVLVQKGLKSYEREYRKLQLFLLSDTVELIAKVDRILSMDGGALLMIGRPGIGRGDIVNLVSHMLKIEIHSPRIGVDYTLKSFKNDLKNVLNTAGIKGEPICLVLEDYQLLQPSFIEHVNSLLSSGEVPGLYTPEEMESILIGLKETMKNESYFGTIYSYFVSRVTKNIRIVLIMDPTNPNFTACCQSNPAIYTKCNIIWSENWSDIGMEKLVTGIVGDVKNTLAIQDFEKYVVKIHRSLDPNVVTPKHFLRFLFTFKKILDEKRSSKTRQQQHLMKGLNKLRDAASLVDTLSKNAEVQKKLLAQKQKEQETALQGISKSMEVSAKQNADLNEIKSKISVEEGKLKIKEDEISEKLSGIKPLLEAAQQAVGQLQKRNLDEIIRFLTPPEPVQDVLYGVLKLMGGNDTSWTAMKKFLSKPGIKEQIMGFEPRNLTKQVINNVKNYLQEKANSFDDKVITRACASARPLAKWVMANVQYAEVLTHVKPLEDEMKMTKQSQEHYKKKQAECEEKVEELQKKIKELQEEFSGKTREAENIKIGIEREEIVLKKAQNLLIRLSDEKERWEKQAKEEEEIISSLPLGALLSSAFITYLGGYPEDKRKKYLDQWKSLININHFEFLKFMSTESELLKYRAEGLPSDELSKENAAVILETLQYPLVIDPAQQATEWLKSHLKGKNIDVTTPQDPKFANTLELAIRFGKTLFIQEIDKIEPILYPLLRGHIVQQGTRKLINIGEKVIDYSEEFQLYLITRNPNILLAPDAKPLVTEVNFTVTRSGLESQLLSVTVQHENPEDEKLKSDLLKREEEDKIQLSDLEKQLLDELAASEGNILENDSLIESLKVIKETSKKIMDNLEECSKIKKQLEEKRDAYKPLARNGSNIFFLIRTLKNVNHMYQFSLGSFLKLFNAALSSETSSATNLDAKIALLSDRLQHIVYKYISRSIFKEHRLVFGMHMVHGLYSTHTEFSEKIWDILVGRSVDSSNSIKNSEIDEKDIKWVPRERVADFKEIILKNPEICNKILLSNEEQWLKFIRSSYVESANIPCKVQLTSLERMLLIKALRPDLLYFTMTQFVLKSLNLNPSNINSLNLSRLYQEESSPEEPILLITTPGSDPSQELEDIAYQFIGRQKFHQMAMGQGQTDEAIHMLRKCAKNGEWLCLKNLHLVVTWLSVLEKEIALLNPDKSFRLWLTSESTNEFPVILLQQSLKITFESPPGIRQNLLRTYENWSPEFISKNDSKIRAQLLFMLSWFHAIIQERRSYIPQGWTKFYEFSNADLRTAADIIDSTTLNMDTKLGEPDWETIYGLLENAIYGGRLDNKYDLRILQQYLYKYFNPHVIDSPHGNTKAPLYPGITVPSTTNYKDFLGIIESMQEITSPEVFTLPPNADTVVQIAQSSRVLESIRSLAIIPEHHHEFNKDNWSSVIIPVLQFWKSLISEHTKMLFESPALQKQQQQHTDSSPNPIDSFVTLEYSNAQSLVKFIDHALNEIGDVIKGTTLLNASTQSDALDILAGTVPQRWHELWSGPEQINSFLSQVVEKTIALSKWLDLSKHGVLLQQTLRLSDLFHPDIFLNALKQQSARKTKRPLDELKFLNTRFVSNSLENELCVEIEGLLLQGCGFDGMNLTELNTDSPSVVELPKCYFYWTSTPPDESKSLSVPVYFNFSREKLLAEVQLPDNTKSSQKSRWILGGVAIFIH